MERLEDVEWNDLSTEPELNEIVCVKLNTGEEKLAMLDEDVWRKCWLIQGSAGQFWRSLIDEVIAWKKYQK